LRFPTPFVSNPSLTLTPIHSFPRGPHQVRSVDGFQGREKEIIVISSVRSNRQGNVGFLKDWRRLNVAVTRARSGLVVVGDSRTLRNERHWRSFVDWCRREGCYVEQAVDPAVLARLYAPAQVRGSRSGDDDNEDSDDNEDKGRRT